MFKNSILWIVILAITILMESAQAHKPIFGDGSATDSDSAIWIDNIDISYVVYDEITEAAPRIWLAFDGAVGQSVYAQLGVPFIDRLEDYRPALVLLGPGLPEITLPFNFPDGLGGLLLTTDDVTEPEVFHEHFTGTDSWILATLETTVIESGRHYLVTYVPSGDVGKLWIAPGKAEVFGLGDIFSLPATIQEVREFHELTDFYFPCFLPVLAAGFLFTGGVWLVHKKKRIMHRKLDDARYSDR